MSRTFKHKLNGKFNNGLIEVKDMPMSILHYWNRMNFAVGEYKVERQKLIEKETLKVDLSEVEDAVIYS